MEGRASSWLHRAIVACAVLFAAFTGFRAVSLWCTTLQSVSITDGFHRRFLVGTLLRPLATVTDFDYWLFASFSYAVLLAVVFVIARVALTSPVFARRVLAIVWLLLPTGGFLFHEVGYFEQVLYLLLFGAFALVQREKLVAATVLISLAPLVHEITALTVLPVYIAIVCWNPGWMRRWWMLAPPIVVNAVVLVIAPANGLAVGRLVERLTAANAKFRTDALDLFNRSQAESRALFDVGEQLERIVPVVLVLVAAFAAFWLLRAERRAQWFRLLLACGAIAGPGLLAFGGWDSNRWVFFVICNFFLMLYLAFDDDTSIGRGELLVLVAAMVLVTRIPLYYFDEKSPRTLGIPELKAFLRDVRRASFWTPKY